MTDIKNEEIMVPSRTDVWLSPVGTAFPAGLGAPADPWRNCGFTPEDSLVFATEPTFGEVKSAQSNFPTLRFQSGDGATVTVDLQQWNERNFKSVYGGGSVTAVTPVTVPPTFKYVPPKIGERTEVAAMLDVKRGTYTYRFMIGRVFQMEGVSNQMHKGAESRLPLKLGVLGSDDVDPWSMVTDDPAFDPAAA